MTNSNSIYEEAKLVLMQLMDTLNQLHFDEYTERLPVLSNGTIGGHTRHIVEIFAQLIEGYEIGSVNYDSRKRDKQIESNIDFACESIAKIISQVEKPNKTLQIASVYLDNDGLQTNYFREMMYNIEHCIHHQAIIKIGLLALGKTDIDEEFGVAKSTLDFRKQCAQ